MARVSGALLSLTASGTIADTLTYATWKGLPYARTRVIPANPRSVSQTSTRDVFAYLQSLYKRMPAIGAEPWIASAIGNPFTPINSIIHQNLSRLIGETDLNNIVLSPGSGGGLPPATAVITPGSGTLTIAVTVPTGPVGWTVTAAQAVAVIDQDPHEAIEEPPTAGEDTTSAYSIVLSGLTASAIYQVGTWLKWATATGKTAYSVALLDQGTPS